MNVKPTTLPDEEMSLVEYINVKRERKGLDWVDIADELDVSVATLYRWRRTGFIDTRFHHLHGLINLLELDPHRFLDLARAA
jgi:hypothetical protein